MYAPERQQEILRLARDGGRVDVLSLAEEFQVTAETVRRDLKALDRAGLLRRVHGGAIPAGRLGFEPDLAEREATSADEKDRIAKAALAELPAEGSVILDAGTTVARLAGRHPAGVDAHRRHPQPADRGPARRPPRHPAAPRRRARPAPHARRRGRLGAARVRRDPRRRPVHRRQRLLRRAAG